MKKMKQTKKTEKEKQNQEMNIQMQLKQPTDYSLDCRGVALKPSDATQTA